MIWKLAISSATLRAVNRPGKTLLVITLALLMPIVPFAIIGELPGERWLSASDDSATLFALTGGGLLLADVLLPVPSSIVISLLGGRLGFVAGWATAWIGLTLGNLLGYWVGRLWPARMAPDVAEQPTLLILILSRPVPILAEAAAIGAGATRANFAHVAGACAAGNAVYTGILTATGASLGHDRSRRAGSHCAAAGSGNRLVALAQECQPQVGGGGSAGGRLTRRLLNRSYGGLPAVATAAPTQAERQQAAAEQQRGTGFRHGNRADGQRRGEVNRLLTVRVEVPEVKAGRGRGRAEHEAHGCDLVCEQIEVPAQRHRHIVFQAQRDAVGVVQKSVQQVVVNVAKHPARLVNLPALPSRQRTGRSTVLVKVGIDCFAHLVIDEQRHVVRASAREIETQRTEPGQVVEARIIDAQSPEIAIVSERRAGSRRAVDIHRAVEQIDTGGRLTRKSEGNGHEQHSTEHPHREGFQLHPLTPCKQRIRTSLARIWYWFEQSSAIFKPEVFFIDKS
ncbi:MAG: hypothetical protein R3E86_14025 [Pseudomonadales bacterium]